MTEIKPRYGDSTRHNPDPLKTLFRMLREKESFLLTTHLNPDGDGLGCEYALFHYLKRIHKRVRIINADPVPRNYSFLNVESIFETYDPALHSSVIHATDVILAIDMNDPRRLAAMQSPVLASPALKIVIDHHLDPKDFADVIYSVESACACGEILFDLFASEESWLPSREIALGLYTAIMTDTGSFRFPRTTPKVHRIVAALLEHGITPHEIYRMIYDEYPAGRTILLGKILSTIELKCGGRVTLSHVTRGMFAETGTNEEDVENIVNYGLTIEGVRATALCVDLGDMIKISLRSVGDVDVRTVAQSFGGGGHLNAAGARLPAISLADALERVGNALCRQVEEA